MIPNFIPTCHFCGIIGHIRPNCFRYIKMRRTKSMIEKKKKSYHWIGRDEYFCNVAQIALKANSSNLWYLDSGCSRHMMGNKSFFETLVMEEGGCVIFGDGSKKKVAGK